MAFDLLTYLGAPFPPSSINRFLTSHILSPLELALLRLLLSFYAFFTIFFSLGYESTSSSADEKFSAQHFLSYFTNLCYWGLAFYFFFAGLHGLAYHFTHRARPAKSVWRYFELEQWPRVLQVAHALLYSSVVTFAPLVTIVFWAVIYKGPFYPLMFDAWRNISVHALNTIFALFEIIIPCTLPLAPLHLPLLILLLLLYLGLAYLTHAISHFYPYNFLDSESLGAGVVTGYCIAILAGVCIVFAVVWALLWIKARIVGDHPGLDLEQRQVDTTTSAADRSSRREGAQGRAGIRRSGGGGSAGAAAAANPDIELGYPTRPSHTRSVSGITVVNDDDQDLELGPEQRRSGGVAVGADSSHSQSPTSPTTTRNPRPNTMTSTRRGAAGEVIELDPMTSEFMRETAVGRPKK